MKLHIAILILCCLATHGWAQEKKHTDKFEQLGTTLRSPNTYRTASGAPGPQYWQQKADYVIEVELNDDNQSITGKETVTYTNQSPDVLTYIWLQLDQNQQAKESDTYKTAQSEVKEQVGMRQLRPMLAPEFEGGFKIASVTNPDGTALPYLINKTMMKITLPTPLKPGAKVKFNVAWSFNINDRMKIGGRSGYEYFEKDGNYLYTIAQFFPRMAVYNDYAGWQHKQFLGGGEFTLPFGDYHVKITVPADHVMGATGELQNADQVLTKDQLKSLEKSKTSDKPVIIVSQSEAEKAEKSKSKEKKTWEYKATNVRDFAFATSRKFIWDAMGVNINGRTVMAMSLYPKEGNPLWEQFSTKAVAHTLKTYSRFTFDYPYPVAYSVHTDRIGMEYPMICFNFGRPQPDGSYDDRTKYSMISVIIHEVGHNFFPMIVNSDERQDAWMDEGLNSFLQFLTEKEWQSDYPSTMGPAKTITMYMKSDKALKSPIMTNPEQVINLGANAYSQPAAALNILRETVMGRELFDQAFQEYSKRWMFKHPTPEDFFRTMEDASAVDLDWFWKGWFYSNDHVDVAIGDVKWYKLSTDKKPVDTEKQDGSEILPANESDKKYKLFYANLTDEQKKNIDPNLNYFELTLNNLGGLVMPVVLQFTYSDGTNEIVRIPAEVWRTNDKQIKKVFSTKKEIKSVVFDPFEELADVDTENNAWPPKESPSRVEIFKESKTGN